MTPQLTTRALPLVYNRLGKRFITEEALLKSSNLGESDDVDNTGFIFQSKEESLLYYDKLVPTKSGKWDIRTYLYPLFCDVTDGGLKKKVLDLSQNDEAMLDLTMTQFTPIRRDGGAFVKFKIPEGMQLSQFNKQVINNVQMQARGTFTDYFLHPRAFPVKGVPWIEDLGRYPSVKLKVEFEGNDLTQENIYALFRRYGQITDIAPPSPDSKSLPRHATVTFRSTRSAVAARQCLNGLLAGNTTLHIQYERVVEPNQITDFISGHPRVFIPLLFALLAGFAVIVFDPIRHFCITEKITSAYSLANSELYREIVNKFTSTRRSMSRMLGESDAQEPEMDFDDVEGLRDERDRKVKDIVMWLEENVSSFIVVQGPAGSGKRNLVQNQALKDRKNVLYIDCEHAIKSRKDQDFVKNLASELGYFPVFPSLASLSTWLDLAVQGMTGQKSGLSETKESQVKSMLTMTANAIRDVGLHDYECENMGEHIKEEDYLRQNPDVKPIVVIDRFEAAKNAHDANAFIYKELADWAASLVTLGIAHVVFITDDVGSTQVLSTAMPTAPLKRAVLSDASTASAENFVLRKLSSPKRRNEGDQSDEKTSEPAIDTTNLFYYTDKLGGRMTDLQMFVRRLQGGDTPKDAFDGLTQQSIEQLIQTMLSPSDQSTTPSGMWSVIKEITKHNGTASFGQLQKLPLLKSDTFAKLQAMENAEVIKIVRDRGIIQYVLPFKPLYNVAFQNMVDDPIIYGSIESDYLKVLISQETDKVAKLEDEIAKYSGVRDDTLFAVRLSYLSQKVNASTELISSWETKLAGLSKPEKAKREEMAEKQRKKEAKERANSSWGWAS